MTSVQILTCWRRVVMIIGASCTVAVSGPAFSEPLYGPAADIEPSLTFGGGIIVKPKYEGSDEHEVIGFPMIIPRFGADGETSAFGRLRKRVSFKGIDDIRFRAFDWNGFEVGPVAGYRTGRDQDDAARLRGLGDVDDGLAVGGYVGLRLGQVLFDASATTQVSGDDTGVLVRLGAEMAHRLSQRLIFTTRVGTSIADGDYAQSFFGVTTAQSIQSLAGLPVYDASAGVKDVFVDVGAKFDLTDKWLLQLGGRYARLVGDAADSPIIETEDQLTGRIAIGYKFSFDR